MGASPDPRLPKMLPLEVRPIIQAVLFLKMSPQVTCTTRPVTYIIEVAMLDGQVESKFIFVIGLEIPA